MKNLNEFRKLAGISNPNERSSWRLEEGVEIGKSAEVAPGTGTESGKVGRVLSVDGEWAQLRTKKNELFWVPTKHLTMVEAKAPEVSETTDRPFIGNLREAALKNSDFRRVVYTGEKMQFTLMHLPPRVEIGSETHKNVEQVFFCVSGSGTSHFDGQERQFSEGDVLVVPQGTEHNIVNTGMGPLKFFTSYSPPNHLPNIIHHTKADADADTADEEFGAKVAKESLDEVHEQEQLALRLKAHTDGLLNMVKDIATQTGTPMEFYAATGDLIAAIGKMLGKGSGDLDLMQMLGKTADVLAKRSEALRHVNSWTAS